MQLSLERALQTAVFTENPCGLRLLWPATGSSPLSSTPSRRAEEDVVAISFPVLLLLRKKPLYSQFDVECETSDSLSVRRQTNAQLSFGNSSDCSSNAYIQHGSRREQTTLRIQQRGVAFNKICPYPL